MSANIETLIAIKEKWASEELYKASSRFEKVLLAFSPVYHPDHNSQARGEALVYENARFIIELEAILAEAIEGFKQLTLKVSLSKEFFQMIELLSGSCGRVSREFKNEKKRLNTKFVNRLETFNSAYRFPTVNVHGVVLGADKLLLERGIAPGKKEKMLLKAGVLSDHLLREWALECAGRAFVVKGLDAELFNDALKVQQDLTQNPTNVVARAAEVERVKKILFKAKAQLTDTRPYWCIPNMLKKPLGRLESKNLIRFCYNILSPAERLKCFSVTLSKLNKIP